MPLLKHAVKKMRQDVKRTGRNDVYRKRLHSRIKEVENAVRDKKTAELPKLLTAVYSIIDTAEKKNLIKRNNANRKKSRMARLVNQLSGKKEMTKDHKEPVAQA